MSTSIGKSLNGSATDMEHLQSQQTLPTPTTQAEQQKEPSGSKIINTERKLTSPEKPSSSSDLFSIPTKARAPTTPSKSNSANSFSSSSPSKISSLRKLIHSLRSRSPSPSRLNPNDQAIFQIIESGYICMRGLCLFFFFFFILTFILIFN